jgi:hypothetical protein
MIIRKKTNEILQRDARVGELSYWAYLYVATLKNILYKKYGEENNKKKNKRRKEYAFLSSAIILDKHLSKEVAR